MNKLILTLILCACSFPVHADEKEARSILQRAIRAAGGERSLNRFKAPMMWMEKGTYHGMGKSQPYLGQYSSKWPNWYRQEIEGVFVSTVSGEHAWSKTQGKVTKLEGAQLKEKLKENRMFWAWRLFPLKDQAYQLSTAEGVEVNGRPTAGLKVTHKNGGECRLYFDKTSMLLVKSSMMLSPTPGAKPAQSQIYFSNHRGFGGSRLPSKMKVYLGGKLLIEAEIIAHKLFATLDPELFEAPK